MILFIDPVKKFLERERIIRKPYPHCGFAYVATTISQMKVPIKILDVNAYSITIKDIELFIMINKPLVVALTAMTFSINDAYEIAELTKRISPNTLVILGGVHATLLPKETLIECPSIDIIVQGEGETTMARIIEALLSGNLYDSIHSIKAITYRDKDKIISTLPQNFDITFDDLPFPDWSLYDYDKYYKIYSEKFKKEINLYQINTGRGCAYNCTFCSEIHSKKVRYRNPDNIVKEIKKNLISFDSRHFDFVDSDVTFRKSNFLNLCKMLIEEKLNKEISWSIDATINHIDKNIIDAAFEAGCVYVSLGIESGSNEILKFMNKKYTKEEAYQVIKLIHNSGLKVKGSFVLGHPYETETTAYETFEFAKKLRKEFSLEYYYNLIDVYPKSLLYEMVDKNEGGSRWISGMRNNWNSYKRTTPMIEVNDLDKNKLIELYDQFTHSLDSFHGQSFYEKTKKY